MAVYEKKKWEESENLKKQQQALEAYKANKPQDYTSQNQQLSKEAFEKWQNYKPFNYDINNDALYNQYKQNYMTQGKLAAQDTLGQATALTGGFNNSYAQSVAQQTYQGYLRQLNDIVPELQAAAYNRHLQGKEDAYNKWKAFQALESQDYDRYLDSLNRYNADYDRLYNEYNNAYNREYSQYQYDDQSAYQQYQDALAQENWQKQFTTEQENWQKQFEADQAYRAWQQSMAEKEYNLSVENARRAAASQAAAQKAASTKTVAYDNGDVDTENVKALQKLLGIPETGYWDEISYRAAGNLSADDALQRAFSDPDSNWRGDQTYINNYLSQSPGNEYVASYQYNDGMYAPQYDYLSDSQKTTLLNYAKANELGDIKDAGLAKSLAENYLNTMNLSPKEKQWLAQFLNGLK